MGLIKKVKDIREEIYSIVLFGIMLMFLGLLDFIMQDSPERRKEGSSHDKAKR